jgi:hypothetical protein
VSFERDDMTPRQMEFFRSLRTLLDEFGARLGCGSPWIQVDDGVFNDINIDGSRRVTVPLEP